MPQLELTKEVCERAFDLFLMEEMSEFLSPSSKEEWEVFDNIITIAKTAFVAGIISWCELVWKQAKEIIESQ